MQPHKDAPLRRHLTLFGALALCIALAACQLMRSPEPLDMTAALCGVWLDPVTGWVYTFAADGSYLGEAPPLADGVNRVAGAYLLDDEGYLEFTLAQQVPRRPFTFYERRNVWHVVEVSQDQMVLVYGRQRVRMVRRSPPP
jgi:hypothetical protein